MPLKRKHNLSSDQTSDFTLNRTRTLLLLLRSSGFLLLILSLCGWIFPDTRLWGFHFYAFLPLWLSLPLCSLALAALTPFGEKVAEKIFRSFKILGGRSALLWAVLTFGLFYSLRVAVPLLGDAQYCLNRLAWMGDFKSTNRKIPENDANFRLKEPLEMYLHEGLFYALIPFRPNNLEGPARNAQPQSKSPRFFWFLETAKSSYILLSCLAGALTVFLLLRFSRKNLTQSSRPLFMIGVFAGGWALFFGYVENYAWVSAAIIATLLFAIEESSIPDKFPWKTILSFLFACSFHYAGIVLLPSILFLATNYFLKKRVNADRLFKAWILIFAAGGAAFYFYEKMWKGWISVIALFPENTPDGYSMFSLNHGIDLINLVCLASVPCLICLIVLRKKNLGIFHRLEYKFIFLSAGAGILFSFVFSPNLGAGRDWDLMSLGLWPLVIGGAWKLSQFATDKTRYGFSAILLSSLLLTAIPFVLVNASETPSIARFTTLLKLDAKRSGYGWETLYLYYETTQNKPKQLETLYSAVRYDDNPRYKINLAGVLAKEGKLVESADLLLSGVRQDKRHAEKLKNVASALRSEGNFSKAAELMRLNVEIAPQDTLARQMLRDLEQHMNSH